MAMERLNAGKMIINYDNVNYFTYEEDVDRIVTFFHYKPKIKTEKLKIIREFRTLKDAQDTLNKKGFYLIDNTFINIKNVAISYEGAMNIETKKIQVQIFFNNGELLEFHILRDRWNAFKNQRLI